jgi:hypothetical protein
MMYISYFVKIDEISKTFTSRRGGGCEGLIKAHTASSKASFFTKEEK